VIPREVLMRAMRSALVCDIRTVPDLVDQFCDDGLAALVLTVVAAASLFVPGAPHRTSSSLARPRAFLAAHSSE